MYLSLQSLDLARHHHRDLSERAAAYRVRRALAAPRPSAGRRRGPARLVRWARAAAFA